MSCEGNLIFTVRNFGVDVVWMEENKKKKKTGIWSLKKMEDVDS